jgi:CspA family cold shock protein
MTIGTVKFFNTEKGFGFIKHDDSNKETFVHVSGLINDIKEGDIIIEFDKVPIRTTEEFSMRVRRALPYSTIEVKVMRAVEEGKPLEELVIPVKMGKQ